MAFHLGSRRRRLADLLARMQSASTPDATPSDDRIVAALRASVEARQSNPGESMPKKTPPPEPSAGTPGPSGAAPTASAQSLALNPAPGPVGPLATHGPAAPTQAPKSTAHPAAAAPAAATPTPASPPPATTPPVPAAAPPSHAPAPPAASNPPAKPAEAKKDTSKEAPKGELDARLQKLESGLASIQDLRDLSEIISVQYNPFLDAEESSPEDRHSAAELLMRKLGLRAEVAAPEPPEEVPEPAEVVPEPPEAVPEPADVVPEPSPEPAPRARPRRGRPAAKAAPGPREAKAATVPRGAFPLPKTPMGDDIPSSPVEGTGQPGPEPVIEAPASRSVGRPPSLKATPPARPSPLRAPRPTPETREAEEEWDEPGEGFDDEVGAPPTHAAGPGRAPSPGGPRTLAPPPSIPRPLYDGGPYGPSRSIGGPREAFLAIHWFTYLAEGTDSSIIFLYLDYYHEAGWYGDAEHAWLERLARGLASRRPNSTWSDYGMDAKRLAHNHLRNLRVLDKLFGATLQHGEAQYLQQTLDALLGEG